MRRTTVLLRGGSFNQTTKFFTRKLSYLVFVQVKLVHINRTTAGGSPPAARQFL